MKSPVKAVIVKGEKSFNKEGYLTLKLSGEPLQEVKDFISLRGLGVGSVVVVKLDDKESKSVQQLRTVHKLIRCYDKYLQAHKDGYIDIDMLKKEIKYKYGIIEYDEMPDKKVVASLKSFADYKMNELYRLIKPLMDEMITVFAQSNWEDKDFESMVKKFNSEPIKPDEEIGLF